MSEVVLHVYDLTRGMASALAPSLIGQPLEGIWHTGIMCYGLEYFYGGGIFAEPPARTPYGTPTKSIRLGETNKTKAEFMHFLGQIRQQFGVEDYSLTTNNCNHFTDACAVFLLASHIPDDIRLQPQQLLSTGIGQLVAPFLATYEQTMKQFHNSHIGEQLGMVAAPPQATQRTAAAAPAAAAAIEDASPSPFTIFKAGNLKKICSALNDEHAAKHWPDALYSEALLELPLLRRLVMRGVRLGGEPRTEYASLDCLRLVLAHSADAHRLLAEEAIRADAKQASLLYTVLLNVDFRTQLSAPAQLMTLRVAANLFAAPEGRRFAVAHAAALVAMAAAAIELDRSAKALTLAASSILLNFSLLLKEATAGVVGDGERAELRLTVFTTTVQALGEYAHESLIDVEAAYTLLFCLYTVYEDDKSGSLRKLQQQLGLDLQPFTRSQNEKTRKIAQKLT